MSRLIPIASGVFLWITTAGAATSQVSFVELSHDVGEDGMAVTTLVTRVGGVDSPCWVQVQAVGGSAGPGRDYVPLSGGLEFAAGATQATVVLSLISDSVPEQTKVMNLVLKSFSNCIPGCITNVVIQIRDAQCLALPSQGFDAGLPAGWLVRTHADAAACWRFDDPGRRGNHTGGRGLFAVADADAAGYVDMDTELVTAPFAVSPAALTYLSFRTDFLYWDFEPEEIADVDLSLNGATGPWTNLWSVTGMSHRGPATEMIDLTSLARGETNVCVRFHYYHANCDYFWQIDDVALLVEPDGNSNGLPDWWEILCFHGLTNLDARADSDHDGSCNGDEFIAGTDPVDPLSVLRIEGFPTGSASRCIEYTTSMGRRYELLYSTHLASCLWTAEGETLIGYGGQTNRALASSASRYYRLAVRRW